MIAVVDDEFAFPSGCDAPYAGLTVRSYFAARAMQGLCTGPQWPDARDRAEIARRAVLLADELIAALNAPPESETHELFR